MNRAILFIVLLLASCAPLIETAGGQSQLIAPSNMPKPTATIVPSATMDYIATAQVVEHAAQMTVDETRRLLIDVTVTHEAVILSYAQMTQSAEQVALQSGMMTAANAERTATAYATSVPMTQTQQAKIDNARSTERAMTINAPTQLVAMSEAEAIAATATFREWADGIGIISVGIGVILIGVVAVFLAARGVLQREQIESDVEIKPIPFTYEAGATGQAGGKRIRAELHCKVANLLLLADGVINKQMTLAFGQWKGTEVYADLNAIRHYFLRHGFAYELQGKGGELALLDAGVDFLRDTHELKSPPLPHVCVG